VSVTHRDAVIIGTGFGGSTVALQLAKAGKSVLLLERGRPVDRDESAWDTQAIHIDRKYQGQTPYHADTEKGAKLGLADEVVGGGSVFYGAASFRLREDDFRMVSRFGPGPADSAFVDWPFSYDDLAPWYAEAERLLGVTGVAGADPTEPPRSGPYAAAPAPYAIPSARIVAAGESLGLRPFPIPLAINFSGRNGPGGQCIRCRTCDLFPCRIEAKNDLSVTVLPEAVRHGAEVRHRVMATRLLREGERIRGVEYLDLETNTRSVVEADVVIVSAGAIASPRLLLASGLGDLEPNGALIGRYLMRHCNGVIIGFFASHTNPAEEFHKQVAFTDFYYGNGSGSSEPWGMIQSLQVPPPEFVRSMAKFPISVIGFYTNPFNLFAMCIAEDNPQYANRVTLHPTVRDVAGDPIAHVHYRHHRDDFRRRNALYREARRILRRAGSWARGKHDVDTMSHALGTCRAGTDPSRAVLDPWCRMFGVSNLYVVDASFMPTSGAANPSLTIAANGLRVGDHIVREWATVLPRRAS